MPFDLPATFQKDVAPTTAKIYKSKLNALANKGHDTVEKIQNNQKEVIASIKEITGEDNDEKSRHSRRTILSAIYWAVPLPKKNQFYTYWQKTIPLTVTGGDDNGKKWKKKRDL